MRKTRLIGYLLLLSAASSFAAETEEVIVTARPLGLGSTEHISQPVSVIKGKELQDKLTSNIGDTLANEPGVDTSGYGPYASRPIIRGLGGNRVLVLDEGISSMDVSTISTDHAVTIEPFQAEQIEIFRGPSTLLYGSGASGGLVNQVTNKIPYRAEEFKLDSVTSLNTINDEFLAAFQAEGKLENVALHLDATHRDANNYEAKDRTIGNSFYDNTDINAGTAYVDDWGHIGLAYGRFESTHGVPENPDEPDELPFLETEQDRFDLSASVNNPMVGIETAKFRLAHNDYEHIEFESVGEPGTTFINKEWQGRLELQHQALGNWNGAFGTQFGLRSFNVSGDEAFLPAVKSNNAAFFILEDTDIYDYHLEIGARVEVTEDSPQANAIQNGNVVQHTLLSFATGIHKHLTDEYALSLNLSYSERAPSIEEHFAFGPHHATGTFEIGNPNFNEEVSYNMDLGLFDEQGRFTWQANAFINYIEDYIFFQGLDTNNDGEVDEVEDVTFAGGAVTAFTAGELQLVEFQQTDAVFYGLEFAGNYSIFDNANGRLDFRLFGDVLKAQDTNGQNLPRISPANIGIGLDYAFNRFSLGAELNTVFEQNDNGVLETDTDGYTLLNVRGDVDLYKSPSSTASLFVAGTNLLDEDARRHASFIKDRAPLAGRSLNVGLRVSF